MSDKHFYITTPIYYVNDRPHLGHAYTTIAADVMARYKRQRGFSVFFLTGTDEHGQKVAQAAQKRGMDEQSHCDAMHQNFKSLWTRLHISNDAFIRTTDPDHKRLVTEALAKLWDKGEIYKKDYEGWYNVSDEVFVTDEAEIERLKAQGKVELVKEANYFFKMGKYQLQLTRAIEDRQVHIQPVTRRNEVLGFLKSKQLGDLSISRPKSRLKWGIELPFDHDHVCYVWVDALLNYISALHYLEKSGRGHWINRFAPYWPATLQFIGKDILTTHSVYWTTLLMALDIPLPQSIFSHGWWTFEGQKMSKSIGNVVDPNKLIDEFGVDALRYFVLREMPFGADGDFSKDALIKRINSDLANDLGNLASRTLNLVEKAGAKFPGESDLPDHARVTKAKQARANEDSSNIENRYRELFLLIWHKHSDLERDLNIAIQGFDDGVSATSFTSALDALWPVINSANQFMQDAMPWELVKHIEEDDYAKQAYDTLMLAIGRTLKVVAILLYPFMPAKMAVLWNSLGEKEDLSNLEFSRKDLTSMWNPSNSLPVKKGEILFPRLDAKAVKSFSERAKEDEAQGVTGTPAEAEITIDQFMGTELRAGQVVSAERVPKSKKLLKLQVAFGEENGKPVRRQVIAGIGAAYEPEAMVGKQVVVVFNLAPAKLMGLESQGMLLAAETEDGSLKVATFEAPVKNGIRVK